MTWDVLLATGKAVVAVAAIVLAVRLVLRWRDERRNRPPF